MAENWVQPENPDWTGNRGFPMPSIADALGTEYRGGLANVSRAGAAGFSSQVTAESSRIPTPNIKPPAPDISQMIGRQGQGVGDNVDVWG